MIIDFLLIIFIIVLSVIIAMVVSKKCRCIYAILFIVFFTMDYWLLRSTLSLHLWGLQWNWIGKILSIVWVLIFLRIGPFSAREMGLTVKHRQGTLFPAISFLIIWNAVSYSPWLWPGIPSFFLVQHQQKPSCSRQQCQV